jgi:hypothetical protein
MDARGRLDDGRGRLDETDVQMVNFTVEQVVYYILGEYAIESHQTTIDSYFKHMST